DHAAGEPGRRVRHADGPTPARGDRRGVSEAAATGVICHDRRPEFADQPDAAGPAGARPRRPGREVAAQLNLKVATAFVARNKVQKMIQEEVRKLEGRSPEGREDDP